MKKMLILITIFAICSSSAFADDFKIEKEGEKYKITSFVMAEEADTTKKVKVKAEIIVTTKGQLEELLRRINDNITQLQSNLTQSQAAKENIQRRIDIITGMETE